MLKKETIIKLLILGLISTFIYYVIKAPKYNRYHEKEEIQTQKADIKIDKELLVKHGLVKLQKLQYPSSWNMAWNEKYIYVVSKNDNAKSYENKFYLEVYDKESFELLNIKELSNSHEAMPPVGIDENYIYIGQNNWISNLSINKFEPENFHLYEPRYRVDGFYNYKNYII
jgi:hypothetical protein